MLMCDINVADMITVNQTLLVQNCKYKTVDMFNFLLLFPSVLNVGNFTKIIRRYTNVFWLNVRNMNLTRLFILIFSTNMISTMQMYCTYLAFNCFGSLSEPTVSIRVDGVFNMFSAWWLFKANEFSHFVWQSMWIKYHF